MAGKWKKILLAILILVIAGVVVAYRMWTKPATKVEDVVSIEISAPELAEAFSNNEAEANKKYLNKAIAVTGTVSESEKNQDGKLVVILTGDVQCTMRDENEAVENGATIKVKGFCTGSNLFGVLLTDCIIVH